MEFEPRFYKTEDHDIIFGQIYGEDVETLECEKGKLVYMEPNTSEGAGEKHKPVISCRGSKITVSVGEIHHPMTREHNIGWVYLLTNQGGHRKLLKPDTEPVVEFAMAEGEQPRAAYAYCNLHGFWRTEI